MSHTSILLKAPRCRTKGKVKILSRDFHKYLLEKHPEFPIKDWKSLEKLCSDGLQKIAGILATEREGIDLPKHVGYIIVGSCDKPKVKLRNHGYANKYGKDVIFNNLHTDGRIAKIMYTNHPLRYQLRNREAFGFVACRYFSRLSSKKFSENPENYMKFSTRDKLSWRFRKRHISNNKNYYK